MLWITAWQNLQESLGNRRLACPANPDESADHMRTIMTDQHIRYLPIMENGALIGVLSFHDVAKAVLHSVNFENKLLKQYIKDWPEGDKAS